MKFILDFIFREIYGIYEIYDKIYDKEWNARYFRSKSGQSQSTNGTI